VAHYKNFIKDLNMSNDENCPKCQGKMIKGCLFSGHGVSWADNKTESCLTIKESFNLKKVRSEAKTAKGFRCTKCGFVEFYIL
jgi:DNA-directed RNA polymerase subunit RPC12/RpoP